MDRFVIDVKGYIQHLRDSSNNCVLPVQSLDAAPEVEPLDKPVSEPKRSRRSLFASFTSPEDDVRQCSYYLCGV